MKIKIVSGGQTGVDQAGLQAAILLGLKFGGWTPHGWLAERWPKNSDSPENGSVPMRYRTHMQEYPKQKSKAEDYRARTKANIRDSDATLILVQNLNISGGTLLTKNTADALGKPCLVLDVADEESEDAIVKWLQSLNKESLVLNVAGPRESKADGVQAEATWLLTYVLAEKIFSMRHTNDEDLPEYLKLCERYKESCGEDFFLEQAPISFYEEGVGGYGSLPSPHWEILKLAMERAIESNTPISEKEYDLIMGSSCSIKECCW